MSNSQRPHGLQPTRLLRPWDFPGKSTGVGCHCLCLLSPIKHLPGNCSNFTCSTYMRIIDIQSIIYIQLVVTGNSLVVQCLGFHAFPTKGTSSILVGELRSHKLCGKAKERERKIRSGCLENRRRQWHPTPVLLPGNSHGRRSLVGCSPWGR